MPKTIRLNESAFKKLMEYVGDEEEFGRYDINNNQYNMSDEEYNSLQQQLGDDTEFDDFMKELVDDQEAEQFIGQDYFDPGPYFNDK